MADDSPINDHSRFRIKQQPKVIVSSHVEKTVYSPDEELADQLHKAVRKTRSKITNLKQEVENKDRVIKRERAMRKAAERGDQDKSSEGRGNTPPERKERTPPQGRRKHRSPHPGDEAEGQGEGEPLTESYYSSEDDGKVEARRDRRRARQRRGRPGNSENERDDRPATYPRRKYDPAAWYGDYGPPPPPTPFSAYATTHNPWVSPHRVPPVHPHYDPRLMHTIGPEFPMQAFPHLAAAATSTPNHQQHQRRSSMGDSTSQFTVPTLVIPAQSGELGQQGDGSALGHLAATPKPPFPAAAATTAPQQIPVTIQIKQSPDAGQQLRSPQQSYSVAESPVGLRNTSRLNASPGSETVNTGVGASPPPLHTNRAFDERGLPLLLDELGAAKDKNKDLSEKCSEAKKEIESLQMQLGVKDAMSEAEIAAKGAALIEEIYTAQREHDEAILARLKLANDERDDAFSRLHKRQSKDGFDSGTDVNSNEEDYTPADTSLNNLLSRLTAADNRSSIDKYGSALVGRISKTKGRRQQITSEEMRAILKEKDVAVAKCKKLEREVIELRKNRESVKSRNNNEKSLKAQLDITRDERDKALVAAKKLKDEIDSLKMYYSLHKSLSQEANLRDQFNSTLGSIEEQVKGRDEVLARTQLNNSQLAAQVRAANDERNQLVGRLQRADQENQQLRGKNQQMERLVTVLRKKIAEGTVKTV